VFEKPEHDLGRRRRGRIHDINRAVARIGHVMVDVDQGNRVQGRQAVTASAASQLGAVHENGQIEWAIHLGADERDARDERELRRYRVCAYQDRMLPQPDQRPPQTRETTNGVSVGIDVAQQERAATRLD
jgi:hypothetical protein